MYKYTLNTDAGMKKDARYTKIIPSIYEKNEYNKKITEAFVKVLKIV